MKRAILAAALALSACGVPTRQDDDPTRSAEAMAPLTCSSRAQCDTYWQRAQVWVAQHSAYRLKLVTDAVIETYGPANADISLAYRILRVPDGPAGAARITISTNCDNFIRCNPSRTDAIIAFKRFVRG